MSPAKKTSAPRKRSTKAPAKQVAVTETKMVPIKSLKMYHKNPRIGDPKRVAKSLHLNSQFKPIVVNIGTHTGRKNEILAGNHTWLGAREDLEWTDSQGTTYHKEPWTEIYAAFVDVDDDHATRIVLADNKTGDDSSYDEGILADIFKSIGDIEGTGYSDIEVDDILASAVADMESMSDDAFDGSDGLVDGIDMGGEEDNRSSRQKYMEERSEEQRDAAAARGAHVEEEAEPDIEEEEPTDAVAEAQVLLELKEDNLYLGENKWSIPDLREDMILEKFPENIGTWGGLEATPDDGKKWFFYNYSLGGVKGLPFERSILAFNTHDTKFMSWWDAPAYYTARIMGRGLRTAVVPDFSFYYTEGRVHHLWGVYRAQWLGRFFQDAGMKVVPRLQFDFRDPNTLEIALLGIPKNPATLECSIQNVNEDEPGDRKKATKILREALDELNPRQFMVYGGNPGWEIFKECGWKGDATHVMNYAGVRRHIAYGAKTGAAKLTKKQRDEVMRKHGVDPEDVKQRKAIREQDIDADETE